MNAIEHVLPRMSGATDFGGEAEANRKARIDRVRQALQGHLKELDALGLTMAAALLDNAISEIR